MLNPVAPEFTPRRTPRSTDDHEMNDEQSMSGCSKFGGDIRKFAELRERQSELRKDSSQLLSTAVEDRFRSTEDSVGATQNTLQDTSQLAVGKKKPSGDQNLSESDGYPDGKTYFSIAKSLHANRTTSGFEQ